LIKLDLLRFKDHLKIKHIDQQAFVFDPIRRKPIKLQPEEMVRQLFIQYLINDLAYSERMIQVERQFEFGETKRRYDLVCFDTEHRPKILVECKAFDYPLNEKVLDQVSQYNLVLKIPYLIVTNGIECHCALIDFESSSYQLINKIPKCK